MITSKDYADEFEQKPIHRTDTAVPHSYLCRICEFFGKRVVTKPNDGHFHKSVKDRVKTEYRKQQLREAEIRAQARKALLS